LRVCEEKPGTREKDNLILTRSRTGVERSHRTTSGKILEGMAGEQRLKRTGEQPLSGALEKTKKGRRESGSGTDKNLRQSGKRTKHTYVDCGRKGGRICRQWTKRGREDTKALSITKKREKKNTIANPTHQPRNEGLVIPGGKE